MSELHLEVVQIAKSNFSAIPHVPYASYSLVSFNCYNKELLMTYYQDFILFFVCVGIWMEKSPKL